ncbi:uncharacterized protein AruCF_5373 [Achromobacter ruhlandii]|nr:uncharacterized protein AruCF_5373 [Achromobacter ruhlandii]
MSAIHEALTHGEVWLSVRPVAGGRPLLPDHHRAIRGRDAILFPSPMERLT